MKVRLVTADAQDLRKGLQNNDIFTVDRAGASHVYVSSPSGKGYMLYAFQLAVVADPVEAPVYPRYNEGDKLRIIQTDAMDVAGGLRVGDIVTYVATHSMIGIVRVKTAQGETRGLYRHQFEKVATQFERYDLAVITSKDGRHDRYEIGDVVQILAVRPYYVDIKTRTRAITTVSLRRLRHATGLDLAPGKFIPTNMTSFAEAQAAIHRSYGTMSFHGGGAAGGVTLVPTPAPVIQNVDLREISIPASVITDAIKAHVKSLGIKQEIGEALEDYGIDLKVGYVRDIMAAKTVRVTFKDAA